MELWTKEIEQKAKKYPLYSQDGKGENAEVIVKYFSPIGAGTWLITEASPEPNGDWLLFGYCHISCWEWGYVLLSELQSVKVNLFGCEFSIERDLYIKEGATIKDLI